MSAFNRNSISLNILGTNGAKGEYYDDICAMSQETINQNFKVLFQQRGTDLSELWYKDKRGKNAVLDAILDPPQIKLQIGSSDTPEFYFEIHIKSGNIRLAADQIQKIDGWIITVRSQLYESQVTPNPANDQDAAEAAAAQLDELKKSYDVTRIEKSINDARSPPQGDPKKPTALRAGDYSIQRLYCVVAQAEWSTPVESYSFLPDPKDSSKKISLKDWRESNRDSSTRLLAKAVSDVLGNWAADNQESAFWNLGIQVRLPIDKVNQELKVATCAPIAVRLQNYPYISSAEQLAQFKEQQKNPNRASLSGQLGHPQNCLVFCEVVKVPNKPDRKLPTGARLDFGGNLAEPAVGSNPGIPGTFVLDRRAYLEGKILVYLRELCVKTSVIPLYPNMFTDRSTNEQQFQSKYVVGGNPPNKSDYPGLPDQIASDPTFDFQWESKGRYAWRKTWPAPGSNNEVHPYTDCNAAPVYRKWSIDAQNSVEVTWKPGDDNILVHGHVYYNHWEAYSSKNPNFGWRGYDCQWGSFDLTVDWSFNIDLCSIEQTFEQKKKAMVEAYKSKDEKKIALLENGVIQPKISGLNANGLPTNLRVTGSGGQYVRDSTDKLMREQVEKSLKEGIEKAAKNIASSVESSGRFIYPGTRTLIFGDPKINDYGDILATVDYIDLEDKLVTVHAPGSKPIDDPSSETKKPVISDTLVTGKDAHITWAPTLSYDPRTKKAKLVLHGLNAAPDPMAFEEVSVQFLPTNNTVSLFNASAFSWKSKKDIDEQERIDRQREETERRERSAPKDNPPAGSGDPWALADSSGNNETGTVGASTKEPKEPVVPTPTGNGAAPADSSTKEPVVPTPTGNNETGPGDTSTKTPPGTDDPWASIDTSGNNETGTVGSSTKEPKEPVVPKPTGNGAAPADLSIKEPKEPVAKPKEPVAKPTEIYDFAQKFIKEQLRVTLDYENNSLIFRIEPDTLVKAGKKLPRFTIPPNGGSFTLTLDGTVKETGQYIIQLDETWNDVNYSREMKGKRSATTFLKCILEEGSPGIIYATSQAEADKTRGVAKP